MSAYPSLKLTYFDFGGRAEAIRLVLHVASIPFVDERLSHAVFAERKTSLPYGKVPVLTVDGEEIAETQGILRYVSRLAGMYPANDALAAMLVDEIFAGCQDFFEKNLMASFNEQDMEKKKRMREEALAGPLVTGLERIEKRLKLIAEYPLFTDSNTLQMHEILTWDNVAMFKSGMLDFIPTDITDKYPAMTAMFDKVAAHPKVKHWVATKGNVKPTSIKLTYFDMQGRAEQIRLAFFMSGVQFEDVRLTHEEFATIKASLPYGQVPILEVDGVAVAQTFALLRYAGTITGLYPVNDPLLAAKVDEVIGHIDETYTACDPSFFETDPEKKKAMREVLTNETLPASLGSLEKRLIKWKTTKSEYALGDKLSIADLVLHSTVQFLRSGFMDHVPTTLVDAYPHIVASNDVVAKHPRVQEWYKTHAVGPV